MQWQCNGGAMVLQWCCNDIKEENLTVKNGVFCKDTTILGIMSGY